MLVKYEDRDPGEAQDKAAGLGELERLRHQWYVVQHNVGQRRVLGHVGNALVREYHRESGDP